KTMWKPAWPGSVPSHECSSSYAPRSGFPGTWLRGQDSLECRVLSAEHSGQFFSQGLRKAWSLRMKKSAPVICSWVRVVRASSRYACTLFSSQFFQQRLRFLQVFGREAFGKPAVDLGQRVACCTVL